MSKRVWMSCCDLVEFILDWRFVRLSITRLMCFTPLDIIQNPWRDSSGKHTQARAQEFEVTGWIQNIAGEKIEGEAQGDESALLKMVKEIKTGPPNAVVVKVETEDIPVVEGEKEFVVKRTVR
ncbi:acylphosphatase [Pseudogymnoascus sp. 23342-1-I1]|nr:acylphosphatase [Pseudogymnoascus sp. 23342-1-I1]